MGTDTARNRLGERYTRPAMQHMRTWQPCALAQPWWTSCAIPPSHCLGRATPFHVHTRIHKTLHKRTILITTLT